MTVKELMQSYRRGLEAMSAEITNLSAQMASQPWYETTCQEKTRWGKLIAERQFLHKVLSDLERVK